MFCEKVFLNSSQNLLENACTRTYFLIDLQAKACNFMGKETLVEVFSCEFEKFLRTHPVAASVRSYVQ